MAKVSLRSYNREIESMIDRGQLDEAIAHCQHILKTYPKHLETYRLLGKAYLEYKRYNDAVDIFMRVLAAEPNDFVANVGISIIRDEENKLDDAIWHMERAFEVQPSNPAIQAELQRLYGRRDGVAPPRIRMTRGALAHMYVHGELYPQAISEIKSVLKEDQGRNDMQVLLARAYYRSGQKNEAADAATAVLRRYPYCLDANRVLVEILGTDRPENAQAYRQRVFELDPYAAHVTGTIFQTAEVGENAVTVERLDWNGQPVGMQPEWRTTQAIVSEAQRGVAQPSQTAGEQPDWLKMGLDDSTAAPPPAKPTVVPPLPAPASPFDVPASSAPAQPTPEEEIPDFLRAAGWGKSTGEFDESKSGFGEGPVSADSGAPIEQGDLPDWVKAMMPQEATQPPSDATPTEEEELPDWIRNIGTGALSSAVSETAEEKPDWLATPTEDSSATSIPLSEEQADWLKDQGQPAAPTAAGEQPDWLKDVGQPAASEPGALSDDSLDWLKGLDQAAPAQPTPANEQPDWLKGLEQPAETAAGDSLDWLKGLDESSETQPSQAEAQPGWSGAAVEPPASQPADELDWLKGLGEESGAASTIPVVEQPDWLTQFGSEAPAATSEPVPAEESLFSDGDLDFLSEMPTPAEPEPARSTVDAKDLGASEQERDDSFAWLEALAAKQGASEGLLTKPEERLQEEPEWVKQAKGMTGEPVAPEPPAPAPKAEDLGKSEQERDDSFAWLEALAAKQGASEGLLTKPEERLQEEPDWVKQAKSGEPVPTAGQPAVQEPPTQPRKQVEELGKSEQERDDSFAWLEALAAKQGASEGLLTKPEERLQEEPKWVKQAKSAPEEPASETPPAPATPVAGVEDLGRSQQEIDDSLAWLENLAAKQGATEGLLTKPEERMQEEPEWVKQVKSAPKQEPVPSESAPSDEDTVEWFRSLEQGVSEPEPESGKDDTVMWLKNLEGTEAATPAATPAQDDLPAWLRDVGEPPAPEAAPASADTTAMWLKGLDEPKVAPTPPVEEQAPVVESAVPEPEAGGEFEWLDEIEDESAAVPTSAPAPEAEEDSLPAWLKGVEEETRTPGTGSLSGLPGWMRDETGEALVEPTKIEPTRATDWQPIEEKQPEPPAPEPVLQEPPQPEPAAPEPVAPPPVEPVQEKSKPAARKPKPAAEPKPEPYREPVTIRGTGMLTMPVDPSLAFARNELSRSNIPGALEAYGKLIKKGRFLDEVIFDLREALYRYPVEVSIWQSLGDAYMRANRLQDALDAYTKAEELLR